MAWKRLEETNNVPKDRTGGSHAALHAVLSTQIYITRESHQPVRVEAGPASCTPVYSMILLETPLVPSREEPSSEMNGFQIDRVISSCHFYISSSKGNAIGIGK
jgi:hypothetical protein